MKFKFAIITLMLSMFHFETVFGDENRPPVNLETAYTNYLELQKNGKLLSQDTNLNPKVPDLKVLQDKVLKDLDIKFDSKKFIQRLGPGVTGGGDSCEQKIAYSFAFLMDLVQRQKIDLSAYNVSSTQLQKKMNEVRFRFGEALQVGRPVEMVNVPSHNLIILDRKICGSNFEPLFYYTPLLLHEMLRLVGIDDGADYRVSNSFREKIQAEIRKGMNQGRQFRIFSNSTISSVGMAWGISGANVDFEEIDVMTRDQQWEFFDKNYSKVENYIVDLKTSKILAVVRKGGESQEILGGPVIELTDMINTNHNDLSMKYDPEARVGMTMGQAKWFGGLETLFAIETNSIGHNQVVGFCDDQCEANIIDKAAYAQMTKAQIKNLEKYPVRNTYYELTEDKNGRSVWKVNFTSETPKTDQGASYTGYMRLSFEKGKFKAVFGKFK